MTRPFHLGWFCNFTAGEWNAPFAPTQSPWDGKFYVEMAQALERACFDYIMLEDTLMVSEAWKGTSEGTLKWALQAPKHDPLPLAAMIGTATSRLGVVATMSTMAYPPFMLARLGHHARPYLRRPLRLEHRDHRRGHRCPKFRHGEAAGAGRPLRDGGRICRAGHAAVRLVGSRCRRDGSRAGRLCGPHQGPADRLQGQVFLLSRGPLNTVPSPQGKPTFLQAGGSPRGRGFAARVADSIIAVANGVDGMKAYRDDVRTRAASCRPRPGLHQGHVPGLSRHRRDRGGGGGQARAHGERAGLPRGRARDDGHGDRYRLLAIRSGAAATGQADHQRRAGVARQVPAMGHRQDAAAVGGRALRRRPAAWSARPTRSPGAWARRWRRSAATAS